MEFRQNLVFLRDSYLLIPLLILISLLFVKIDSIINKKDKSQTDYVKTIALVLFAALTAAYSYDIKDTFEPMLTGGPGF